jgi:hypothetical protein
MKNLGQDSRSLDRDLNPGPPGYEAGVLNTQPRRSAPDYQTIWFCLGDGPIFV